MHESMLDFQADKQEWFQLSDVEITIVPDVNQEFTLCMLIDLALSSQGRNFTISNNACFYQRYLLTRFDPCAKFQRNVENTLLCVCRTDLNLIKDLQMVTLI